MISPMFMPNPCFRRELHFIWRWFLSLGLRLVNDMRLENVDFAPAPDSHGRSFPTLMASYAGGQPDGKDHCGSRASTMRSALETDGNYLNSFYEISRYAAALGPPFFTAWPTTSPTWRRGAGPQSPSAKSAGKSDLLAENNLLFHR